MRTTFRIGVIAALIAVLALGLIGCSDKNVAAKVNGEAITLDELNEQIDQLKEQYPSMFDGADGEGRLLDFKKRLLDNLIDQKLIAQAAEEQGVDVTDSDIDNQIEQLKSGFTDDDQFASALKSAGMTEDSLRDQVREQLLTQQLMEEVASSVQVSDAEVESYYEKNKSQFYQQPAKRASHILFKPEDKKTAEKVLKLLKDGGDFSALAKEYSQDESTKDKGGDLGWPTTAYVSEFEDALDKLGKGEMSGLVKSPYGYHIILVTDERTGTQQTLAEAKDKIVEILQQEAKSNSYQDYLDKLREDADIEILIPELKASTSSSDTSASTN